MIHKALWAADLLLAVLFVGAVSLLVLLAPEARGLWRVALALPALLVVPGYLLTLTLFPGRSDLSGRDRAVLSLGYSLMAVPLLGLLLSALPWGVTPGTLAAGLCAWTAILTGAAGWRRRRYPAALVFSAAHHPDGVRTAALFLGVSLAALLGLGALMQQWHADVPFSEFYLLGPAGRLGDYPTRVQAGTLISLTLAVRNSERRATSYQIQPSLCREILQVPTLAPGQEWRTVWKCRPGASDQAVPVTMLRFDLYRKGDRVPYRTLALRGR